MPKGHPNYKTCYVCGCKAVGHVKLHLFSKTRERWFCAKHYEEIGKFLPTDKQHCVTCHRNYSSTVHKCPGTGSVAFCSCISMVDEGPAPKYIVTR